MARAAVRVGSAWLNLNPADIRVFSNEFYDFEAPEKKEHSPLEKLLLRLPALSALSLAFMVKNALLKTRIWLGLRFNDFWSLNLNMMFKIAF
jgi:hypothetical protein